MLVAKRLIAGFLVLSLPLSVSAGDKLVGNRVKYAGGSLATVKSGEYLNLFIDANAIRILHGKDTPIEIKAAAITEINYGEQVRRRIEEAAALGAFTLGIGAIMAFSKAKKHFVGIVWADEAAKGAFVFQARKDDFRGILLALENITGKKAVDTDPKKNTAAQTAPK